MERTYCPYCDTNMVAGTDTCSACNGPLFIDPDAPTESIHAPDSPPAQREYPTGGDPKDFCVCGHHEMNHANYADRPRSCNQTGCECAAYRPESPLPAAELPVEQSAASTIREGVDRLRAIPGAWKEREDPLADLQAIHEGRLHDVAPDPRPVHREEPQDTCVLCFSSDAGYAAELRSGRVIRQLCETCANLWDGSDEEPKLMVGHGRARDHEGNPFAPPSIDTREPAELPGKVALPPEFLRLKQAAEQCLTHNQNDYDWPVGEMLRLPPFYDHRVYLAVARPKVVLAAISQLAAALQKIEALTSALEEAVAVFNGELGSDWADSFYPFWKMCDGIFIDGMPDRASYRDAKRAELAESQLAERDRVIHELRVLLSDAYMAIAETQTGGTA